MKHPVLILIFLNGFLLGCSNQQPGISLTLIPPEKVTDKVDVDIRAGICNHSGYVAKPDVKLYLNSESAGNLLLSTSVRIAPDSSCCVRFKLPAAGHQGKNVVILVVSEGRKVQRLAKSIEVLSSASPSGKTIDGAWVGLYHWSETEGKNWNADIRNLTDDQWKEMVRSMHKLGMDIIVIQEVFRNQEYAGKNKIEAEGYKGRSFYPSKLFKDRMPITAGDPVEAILSQADELDMNVFVGVGLYAWFDFSPASLTWHKKVAKELWDMYGQHPSFYGFYVSEESGGSLDNWEKDENMRIKRRDEILNFFKEFKSFCNSFAPSKPIMLATNSMGIPSAEDAYPQLLKNLDILCPFGFSRMPADDITGEQAARLLQEYCDKAGAHLWFDLEAFLFNEDGSLYPRPIDQIRNDLLRFSNFEKTICYQYPGVFCDPGNSFKVGDPSAVTLFEEYKKYLLTFEKN